MVKLGFIKVLFALNLLIGWSGSMGFDPSSGPGSILHVVFVLIFRLFE